MISNATDSIYIPKVSGEYYSIVTLNGCSSEKSNILNILITGVKENSMPVDLLIYPNPTSGKINIVFENSSENCNYEILNLTGQIIFQKNIPKKGIISEQIDLSGQPFGLYFLKIQSTENIFIKKFIIL